MRGTEIDIVWSMTVRWVADCRKDLLYDILDSAVILETPRGEFSKRLLQMVSILVKNLFAKRSDSTTRLTHLKRSRKFFRRQVGTDES